ncbi:YkgJ family cysteine cluster protein [Thauera sp. CAU 1555]|uniref:YkgJ family cysteine cluster protein n=1 Tax=Thauera sedimentorum TaxID=2767595 RepID=A0ABR9B5A9_9RHOO|nr:YkgJ family cysteine cluster protein [Thauera sedimentorum]MBC9070652.1 YkgJ family cysteine cluster protein [Thauera sedimentorum]MBD8501571.1 YkgJ family cysteine cluster protein [Thauera sedimentorum]
MTELERQLRQKIAAIVDGHDWMDPTTLESIANRIRLENASRKTRRMKLLALADRFNTAIAPHAACRSGCGACCSMTTMIYAHEAEVLAQASGRRMTRIPARPQFTALTQARAFFGTPCPFLKDSRCSVYEVRPIICRLHHSLNDDASACDTSVPTEERKPVGSYDVDRIEMPYHLLVREGGREEPWGEIHEFFPD